MTAPVTVSERDLRVLLGIVSDRRRDIPDAGLPPSLLAELSDQAGGRQSPRRDAGGVPVMDG